MNKIVLLVVGTVIVILSLVILWQFGLLTYSYKQILELGLIVSIISNLISAYVQVRKEKISKGKILHALLDDFTQNQSILEALKGDLENNRPISWTQFSSVFIGFRDDGWNEFRTKGGGQYIKESKSKDITLSREISDYYTSQWRLHKEINTWVAEDLHVNLLAAICEKILPKIEDLLKKNRDLQKKIGGLL